MKSWMVYLADARAVETYDLWFSVQSVVDIVHMLECKLMNVPKDLMCDLPDALFAELQLEAASDIKNPSRFNQLPCSMLSIYGMAFTPYRVANGVIPWIRVYSPTDLRVEQWWWANEGARYMRWVQYGRKK